MSELTFTVLDVAPERYAVAPNLTARLRIDESTGATVHALALRCQVRIEPQRRRYTEAEAGGLIDLFGPTERWRSTLRAFPWLQCSVTLPGFTGTSEVELAMPCTYDFEVSASKYLHALGEGTVPLVFLFSGTVFTRGAAGFGVEAIPWDREADYDMPAVVWRNLMQEHFPNSGWIRLDADTLRTLTRYKSGRGLLSLDAAVVELLQGAGESVG
ncbi:DUF6084 family protein [Rhodococcus sp. NPDC059234]|uniref:DUF6084 family protein n=1 Tax=Rhodococcus sp. NPDC059234 TaxID=3346781 RepID=UPI00366EAB4C